LSGAANLAQGARKRGHTERKDVVKLGAALADAKGFRVVALDGREVGEVEHVRYERHADHPDEIVIKRRFLLWARRGVVKFDEVSAVDADHARVYLTIPTASIESL
jgi:hypothetical protein